MGVHIDEATVHQVVNALSGKTHQSLYSFYSSRTGNPPICGKGSVYKIKKLYDEGELEPYLEYLSGSFTIGGYADEQIHDADHSKQSRIEQMQKSRPEIEMSPEAINNQDNHTPLTVSNRESEILTKLNKYLIDVKDIAKEMTGSAGYGMKKEDYIEPFQKAINLAQDEFNNGRIFLPVEFIKAVEALFQKIAEMNIEFETAMSVHTPDGLERAKYWDKAKNIAFQEIPKLRESIENQARIIIKETNSLASQNELERDKPLKEIIVEAQKQHLEKVRTQLLALSKNFKEIDLNRNNYYADYTPINEDIRSHLPDGSFWQNVDSFKASDDEFKIIYKALYVEIKSKGESEIGSLDDSDSGGTHITSNFITTIIELAVKICLGEPDDYHRYEWIPSVSKETFGGNFISVGIHSETKLRKLVQTYAKDKRCEQLAAAVKGLRPLREDILSRITKCVDDDEYIHYFCSRCHRRWYVNLH